MMPDLNFQLDDELLNIIEPPQQYPPTLQYFMQQNDSYFIKQCKRFLINQKDSYLLSKKIESNLGKILNSSKQFEEISIKKDSNADKIYKELRKLNENKKILQKRQKTLSMICDLIKLQSLKGSLLLQQQKSLSQKLVHKMSKKSSSDKSIPQVEAEGIRLISQQQRRTYLQNLQKLYSVIKQSSIFNDLMANKKFPLIQSILTQLHELFSKSIEKALSSQMLTPDMIKLILTEFYQPFLFNQDLYIKTKKTPKDKFTEVMINNRVQKYRLELNPLINNLNYANNVIDLYDGILDTWLRIIDQDLKLFSASKQVGIVKSATKLMLNEAMPKLQKNTYKMKEMSQICYIRFKIHQFLNKLNSIQILQGNSSKELHNQQKWYPLPSMLEKMKIFLQSKIQQQSQMLSTTKYNIYSLASYLPIRQYLQTIKSCIEYDFQRPPDLQFGHQQQSQQKRSPRSPSIKYLDWQQPFYTLAISRKPHSQPNNKSLVIFNLNIWYLYLKIIKQPSHKIDAVQTMLWCKEKFVQMNVRQTLKIYYDSLDKILQLCGNLPVFRNTLYAEINMLGHDDLRNQLAKAVKDKFIEKYQEMLKKIGKDKMENEQVKNFCKENKINLNKFGKNSSQICIYSVQELNKLIQYN